MQQLDNLRVLYGAPQNRFNSQEELDLSHSFIRLSLKSQLHDCFSMTEPDLLALTNRCRRY
jgi:hypothetical protein